MVHFMNKPDDLNLYTLYQGNYYLDGFRVFSSIFTIASCPSRNA